MASSCNSVGTGIGASIIALTTIDGLLTAVVAGINVTVSLAVAAGGMWDYDIWLSDSATDSAESLTKPTDPPVTRWKGTTDANGAASWTFKNANAAHTWYLHGNMVRHSVSAAITAGV